MNQQRFATALTVINLVLLAFILVGWRPAMAEPGIVPVLRDRSLEIVGEQDGVRLVTPATTGPDVNSAKMNAALYRTCADLVLITHVAFVGFVVIGLLLILIGGFRRWAWVRNPWFRALHLCGIGLVVVQAWLGIICPLTTLEMYLRGQAGDETYGGTFVAHWLQKLLYYRLPWWVFVLGYSAFGLAVIGGWLKIRPRPFRSR